MNNTVAKIAWTALVVAALFMSGCGPDQISFEYGKAVGDSVNGISLFADMLRDKGHKIIRQKRLSKRLDKVQTIVWAPANEAPLDIETVGWLEDWLQQDANRERLLIFVGRGYDAERDYLKQIASNASAEEFEVRQRQYNQGRQSFDLQSRWIDDESEDLWFGFEDGPAQPTSVSGPWSAGLEPSTVPLDVGQVLVPLKSYQDHGFVVAPQKDRKRPQTGNRFREGDVKCNELLVVDDQPFAFEIVGDSRSRHRVIVISNASFLLNFPLVTNPQRRKLASAVADECIGDVAILETTATPPISSGLPDSGQKWAWIAQPPMRYIVPHFLFWGVLYCFVFYPIFGRPKKVKFHPAKSFGSHVKAVGEVMRRSGDRDWARERIEEYNQRSTKH